MVWNADPRHRLADLVAGSIDGMDRVRIGDEAKISANPDLVLMPTVGLATAFLGINARTVPFDDPSVREAVALGIDRQALVDAAFPSGSTVARYLTPCSVPHGCRGTAFPEVDRPAAKDLLDQAGFPTFTTTIAYADAPSSYLPNPAAAAENLRSQLAEIGITATLKPQPADALIAAVDSGKSPGLFLLGTVARMPDVTEFLERNVGSGAGRFGGVDRSLTAALKKAATAVSDDDRAPAYTAVNDALRRTVPLVPLAHPGWNVAYRSDVAAAHTSPLASERFAAMTPGDRRQIAWAQATEPESLYCADEDEADTLRACAQIGESLYAYEPGEASLLPALATDCQTPKPLTTWTCTLRRRVVFHDGSRLDAADVVMSFAAQWDAANPLHRGRTGDFRPFLERFRGFLNPPTP
jgi:ABC-type transport system substrate-binding protein